MNATANSKPSFVYVTYIATSPEKVWQALTKPDISEKYWFGYRVQSDGGKGGRMTAHNPAGKLAHDDPIIESDPPKKLAYAWKPLYRDMADERAVSRVTQAGMSASSGELIMSENIRSFLKLPAR